MAWMPVSEAAAILSVSERTIWRRIKSDSIPSKSENGRTFVGLEDEDDSADPVRQLSHVAAAQLSMRKLDADSLNEVLALVRDYRGAIVDQARRSRRVARVAVSLVAVLVAAAAFGGWCHLRSIRGLERDSIQALADAQSEFDAQLSAVRERSAHDAALAEARRTELDAQRALNADQRQHVSAVESARDRLQTEVAAQVRSLDERLAGFKDLSEADRTVLVRQEQELADLRASNDELHRQMADAEAAHQTLRRMDAMRMAATRRAAEHERGLVEGLRVHIDFQQQVERQLRRLLAEQVDRDAAAPATAQTPVPSDVRERILHSVIGSASRGDTPRTSPGASATTTVDAWRMFWGRYWALLQSDQADDAIETEFARAP